MRALLARLLRSLTSTTLSAQLAGMLIGGIWSGWTWST